MEKKYVIVVNIYLFLLLLQMYYNLEVEVLKKN